jgi:hypothetical protein
MYCIDTSLKESVFEEPEPQGIRIILAEPQPELQHDADLTSAPTTPDTSVAQLLGKDLNMISFLFYFPFPRITICGGPNPPPLQKPLIVI